MGPKHLDRSLHHATGRRCFSDIPFGARLRNPRRGVVGGEYNILIHGNLLQYSCLENLMDGGAW